MATTEPNAGSGALHTNQLRRNSLGVAAITFFVISAAAPLTAVAGGVPISILLGNGAGIPGAFVVVMALLLVFAVGYLAMARHVKNAGAFYSFASQAFGGYVGGPAALIAMLSYNAMQIGVMGLLGVATAGLFAPLGLDLPWWVWSFVGIAATGFLGYRHVEVSARVLTLLVIAEFVIVFVIDLAVLFAGGDSGLNMQPFTSQAFFSGAPAIGILFCFAASLGFEATTIYAEEARDRERTVPRAAYLSILIIGIFYAFTSWCMVMASGMDKVVGEVGALPDPTAFLFVLADRYVGHGISTLMTVLFVSSLFACVQAFHNSVARYFYVAGRERLLPAALGQTHVKYHSPHIGSVVQTIIATIVVAYFAFAQLDPVLNLFSWLTNLATLGILVLMWLSSVAVMVFFAKNKSEAKSPIVTTVFPALAVLSYAVVIYQIVINFGMLAGTDGMLAWFLPSLIGVAAVVGLICAAALRGSNRALFDKMGREEIV